MNWIKLSTSILLAIFALAQTGFGQEQQFPECNFAITPPEGWIVRTDLPPQKGMVAVFSNTQRTRLLTMVSMPEKKDSGILDERYMANFEKGLENSGGGPQISGKFIEVQGLKGYERLGGFVKGGKQLSSLTHLVLVNGRSYCLIGMRTDGDANNAMDIQACLASFRFLTPPEPPKPSAQSAAFQVGYIVGRSMLVIFGVTIVAGIIVGTLRGRKSRRNPATPPPPPH